MQRLILFDIDETMISSDGAGRRAIGRALLDMFNVRPEQIKVSMSGKTDPQILNEILKAAGMTSKEIAERMDEMFEIYISLLEEEIEKAGRYFVHGGVVELLEQLSERQRSGHNVHLSTRVIYTSAGKRIRQTMPQVAPKSIFVARVWTLRVRQTVS